jgi:pyrimidine deaminase RibD-like protein
VAGRAQEDADLRWLREAVELSKRCPPSDSAFSVGAILVGAGGQGGDGIGGGCSEGSRGGGGVRVIAAGYSRQRDPHDHAEEVALAEAGAAASGGTIYTSLEPCLRRLSRPRSCAELIVAAGVRRVVLAWREPPLFVPGGGADWLRERGIEVAELPELADAARSVNAHLLTQ